MTDQEHTLELVKNLWHALRDKATGAPGVLGVFEGSMTDVYRSTAMSMSHYSKLYKLLQEMGCIVVERKGRRQTPSRIVLLEAPSMELFDRHVLAVDRHLTNMGSDAILQLSQRIGNIEGRLQGIDLQSALVNIERRLQALETKGESLEDGKTET